MATPVEAINKSKAFARAISILQQPAGESNANDNTGAATVERIRRRMWTCAGIPSGAAPAGMLAGDWILDVTNSNMYWYISGTTYVQMNQTS